VSKIEKENIENKIKEVIQENCQNCLGANDIIDIYVECDFKKCPINIFLFRACRRLSFLKEREESD